MRKIDIFPKGLTHGFDPNMAIFPTFFFSQYWLEKWLLRYSRRKKTPFLAIKTRSWKRRKIEVFPKGLSHGFGSNMAFFPTFFLGNIGLENDFYDILERKNAFLGYENKKFKMLKNWRFSKGVNPWVWSKTGHFFEFFFLFNIGLKNDFYDIIERKKRLSRL